MKQTAGTAAFRRQRRARIAAIARKQGGYLTRRQLYEAGLTRWEVRAEISAGRWSRGGRQTVRVLPGLPQGGAWRAILEVGPKAVVDGVSALIIDGLRTIDENALHVIVPKSSTPLRCTGVVVHESRRYDADDVIREGVPRLKPATAAVHAALWARSDAQAALFLVAPVQQEIVRLDDLDVEVERVRRSPRRTLLRAVLADLSGGAESMGEREFARLSDVRGFPRASRQVRRSTPNGKIVLDNEFDDYDLTVEIDGAQHLDAAAATGDALKQNAVALEGRTFLRIPVWALRTNPDPFLDQVEAVFLRKGWRRPSDGPAGTASSLMRPAKARQ